MLISAFLYGLLDPWKELPSNYWDKNRGGMGSNWTPQLTNDSFFVNEDELKERKSTTQDSLRGNFDGRNLKL